MGFTCVEIDLANVAEPGRHRSVQFLVDTGALLTVVPASVLQELGIQPVGQRSFRGFGGVVQRSIGGAQFRYQDSVAIASVMFGEDNDPTVLGVTALEALGYQVDPTTQQIKQVESLQL